MFKNSLKKLIAAVSAVAMTAAMFVPVASAVSLSAPVAIGEQILAKGTHIGKSGVMSGSGPISLTALFGDYILKYDLTIQKPMESFSLTMHDGSKVAGFFTLDTYNAEANTLKATWVEKATTNLTGGGVDGVLEIGKKYTLKYEFKNVGMGGAGLVPALSALTVTDEEGTIVAKGTNLPLRNFADLSNGASKSGFSVGTVAITPLTETVVDEETGVETTNTLPAAVKFGSFVATSGSGADAVEVFVNGSETELSATGNEAIEVPSAGTGDEPIVFDTVVKQGDIDVTADYNVIYSINENGYSFDDNELTIDARASELNPILVVSLADEDGNIYADSYAEIELNINKEAATAEDYLDAYIADLELMSDGEAVEVKNGVYQCGSKIDLISGDGTVEVSWECFIDEDEECDNITITDDAITYEPLAGYYDNYTLVATIAYGDTTETKSFECNFYDYALEVEMDKDALEVDDETDENLDLPTKGEYGSTITWTSSNPSVISRKGNVKRGSSDKEVTLTATIEKGNISEEVEFEVTVLKKKSSGGGGGSSSGGSSSSASIIDIVSVVNPTPAPIATPAPTASPADAFTDLDSAAWAKPAITALANRYVINGKTATTFAPNDEITRAEFAKILISAFGLVNPNASVSGLSDVTDSSAWYYNSIASAFEKGIITGYADGSFGINDKVTRQDMAVMIYRAAKAANKTINVMEAETIFADADQIGDYAKEAVTALQRANVINGVSDTEFAPTATATRAQAAQMVYGLIK